MREIYKKKLEELQRRIDKVTADYNAAPESKIGGKRSLWLQLQVLQEQYNDIVSKASENNISHSKFKRGLIERTNALILAKDAVEKCAIELLDTSVNDPTDIKRIDKIRKEFGKMKIRLAVYQKSYDAWCRKTVKSDPQLILNPEDVLDFETERTIQFLENDEIKRTLINPNADLIQRDEVAKQSVASLMNTKEM